MAGEITFTGLSSNMDLNEVIDGLVSARRSSHIHPLENWKTQWETKLESISTIDSALSSFYTTVRGMDGINEFLVRSAASSDETTLTTSATSEASIGSHSVVVNQLAAFEKEVHTNGESGADTIVNGSGSTQTFKYRYTAGGAIITVDVPDGTTLTGLKNLINNDPDNPGVTASVLNTGGGANPYHLVLSGEDTGADNTIVVDPDSTATLTGYTNGTFTESQSAMNSQIRADGYPSLTWIERTTNRITDVIDGVTLNLMDTGTTTVTVSTDKSAILEKVEAFREAFNDVRTAVKEATRYDAETGQAGSLLGNYAIQIVRSKLDSLVAATAPGFRDPDDTYVNLQQFGFSTDIVEGSDTAGLLLLDTSILSNALDADPEAVADVFSACLDGTSNDSQIAFQSALSSTTPGIYAVEVDLDPVSENFRKGRFCTEGGSWNPWVDLSGTSGDYTLTGAAGYPEQGIGLHITYTDGALHSSEVRLKNGVVRELSLELEDLLSSSGPLNTITDNYNQIIDNIELRIENEERRLDNYEKLLRQRFARLDAYISQMDQLGNYLTLYVANLSKK